MRDVFLATLPIINKSRGVVNWNKVQDGNHVLVVESDSGSRPCIASEEGYCKMSGVSV